ncbi:hypothetical protein RvY_15369 [Ramazzottius varieornatus]|uniref:Selenoprotein O n=1 Tax=Ramazzottius varieornatus TaxID=947166 RepID=A0A1D1VVZ0_RAMVA|nr:hypothetical protein RvY_15369 [Ramazzottius varieornatus]
MEERFVPPSRLLVALFAVATVRSHEWQSSARTGTCYVNANHSDTPLGSLFFTPTSRVCSVADKTLHRSLQDWRFNSFRLLEQLPIDSYFKTPARFIPRVIFSKIEPTPFRSKVKLMAITKSVLEDILDMNGDKLPGREEFVDFVSGNVVLPGSVPLAHRYGGHQFGSWANQLGDGRAIMLGEYVNKAGEHWELQLKGSGKTPYSRSGDGRAVLRSSIREFLCSEAMYHLGVPTSRAASLVVSDDTAYRDQFYDGHMKQERTAVVLRLAPTWFRFGSLEILAKNGETKELKQLVDFILREHFTDWISVRKQYVDEDYIAMFGLIVNKTADMIAKWQSVGFSHGVCNTDNFSLLSITIDFGPFGFLDAYNPDFIPNFSDSEGRYSYKNQPDVGLFNVNKLREAFWPLLRKESSKEKMHEALDNYYPRFWRTFQRIFRNKLGLIREDPKERELMQLFLSILQETKSDFTASFRQLGLINFEWLEEVPSTAWALKKASKHKKWTQFLKDYEEVLKRTKVAEIDRVKLINATNPVYILRNWMAERAIRAADMNDFSEIWDLQKVLEKPFDEQAYAEERGFSKEAPNWSKQLKVSCSS